MTKNETDSKIPVNDERGKLEITEEQRQRQKKMIVYPAMFIVFVIIIWFIFAPFESENIELNQGFNTDIPQATDNKLMDDKQKAYEQAQMEKSQEERKKQMQDLASMFHSDNIMSNDELYYDKIQEESKANYSKGSISYHPKETIKASANAYHNMNRTLGSFYEMPKEDSEKEELKHKLEEMRARIEEMQSTPKSTMDEQIALIEKSYELAAKYNQGNKQSIQDVVSIPVHKNSDSINSKDIQINNIEVVCNRVISRLEQPIDDSTFLSEYTKLRNMKFHTAVGNIGQAEKNTIKACIHNNQTIINGQAVRLRLLETMKVGTIIIPQNALITGICKIEGERLSIIITTLEYNGLIIPVKLIVVDTDGQEGIFIPGSIEMSAINEFAANLGGNLGTTINLNQQNAGNQLLTELGKGVIQGASQYISKKMRIVKVHLKEGYKLMLYQNK